jgi:hypothetical protein
MSDFRIDKITNRAGDAGTQVAGITTFSGTSGMQLPAGPTQYRGGRGRGVFYGGTSPTRVNTIEYIEIATTGNAVDFGDANKLVTYCGSCASSIRGVFIGGEETSGTPGYNEMYYVTFSSQGGANDFGTLETTKAYGPIVTSNNTRGVINFGYGSNTPNEHLSGQTYIEIATQGNGSFWGDLAQAGTRWFGGDCASPTRGMFMGGIQSAPGQYNPSQGPAGTPSNDGVRYMTYLEFATLGSQYDFGELSQGARYASGSGSSTRGLCNMGTASDTANCVNTIEYVTISTTGNAQDFGDLSVTRNLTSQTASQTRGVTGGGQLKPSPHPDSDVIDYVTIAHTGNSTDFGNLTVDRFSTTAASDCHGGIG